MLLLLSLEFLLVFLWLTFIIKMFFRRCSSTFTSLKSRGILSKVVPIDYEPELDRIFSSPQCFYCGFDPTADSLHIGHLAPLMLMFRLQRLGHTPIALIGSATALIGDPTGKTVSRLPLSVSSVHHNVEAIRRQVKKIEENHMEYFSDNMTALPKLRIVDNLDWYQEKRAVDFLIETKGLINVADLLKKDSVKERLHNGQSLSFAEFSYQIFQAFDWLHLFKKFRCVMQIGGHDQLGNIMTGYEMVKRATGTRVFGVTVPLVKSAAGDKLGKTAGNAIWLDSARTSPFELFQFFCRLPDADMINMFRLFTFMTENEIYDILEDHKRQPELRKAQKHLAKYITKFIHGAAGVDSAITCSEVLYGGSASALASLSFGEVRRLFSGVPHVELHMSSEMTALELAVRAGCFADASAAESIIREGGFSINYRRVVNPNQCLIFGEHILLGNNASLLRVGKKNFYLVSWRP